MRGEKKTGEDARKKEPARVIQPASPKQFIRLDAQKKYFQEVVVTFSQLEGARGPEAPLMTDSKGQGATGTLIEE